MSKITIKDIKALNPCYDPTKHLPEDWSGTVQELLCYEHIPAADRLWVAVRTQFLSDRVLKEYGVACARLVEHLANDSSVAACNQVTERFLDGVATEQDRRATYAASSATALAYAIASDSAASAIAASSATATAASAASAASAATASSATAFAASAIAASSALAHAVYAYATIPTSSSATAFAFAHASREEMQEQQCQLLLHVIEMVGKK